MSHATPSSAAVALALGLPLLILSGCGGGDPATGSPVVTAAAEGRLAVLPGFRVPVDSTYAEKSPLVFNETIQLAQNYTALVAGTINGTADWPVWYGNGRPVDGVNCLVNGNYHKHALISIYSDGKRLGFPDGIGRVHAGCYHAYEMHVHDVTGIIHMESDVPKQFKLGQWFSLWQQPLSRDNVAGLAGPARFYIIENGTITRYDGVPSQIDILPHREVLIVTGVAMSVVPKYQWPAGI